MNGFGAPSHPRQREVDVRVLEAIADARPLPVILDAIASDLEQLVDGWLASILMLSADGTRLHHGAAPSLPRAYTDAIDGAPVGPVAGSCGTAAYRRSPVVVSDIAIDPLWARWRDVALAHGLRACWSVPVVDLHGVVLATFAVYHHAPARPEPAHMELIARFAHLARIAIQHDRTQRDLRASEEWFRTVFRDAAFGLAVTDRTGTFTHTNLAYRQMVGHDEADLQTRTLAELTHPDDRAAVLEALRTVVEGEQTSCVLEARALAKAGRTPWVRVTLSARRDADGRVIDTIAIAEDVSQRRADEDARRQQQLLLQMASRVGRLGAWAYDVATGLPHLSPEALGIHEMDGEVAGDPRTVASQYDPEHLRLLRDAVAECSQHGVPFDLEARLTTARGNRRWVRLIGEAVRDAGGAIVRVQGALQDITDRKELEQQSLRSQRLESIGTLAGGIAHDLNNVLTPIAMGVGLLKAEEHDPGRLQLLGLIEASAARAADMVRQVLAFARGAEGERRPLAPAALVRDVAALIGDTLPKQIRLDLDVDRPVPTVEGDATQLHQVLLNLCVNARDAMPDGGRLRLSVHTVPTGPVTDGESIGPAVCLRVEDTGEGIAPDVIDKIFDPFFTTKPTGRGTGLGLSTSLGIVRSHGGRIDVSSQLAQGSRFDVVLPATPGATERGTDTVASPDRAPAHGTVLLVDDEPAVRMVSRHVLRDAGYAVVDAGNAEQALERFAAHRDEITVVLTDMMMPGLGGPELVRRLRQLAPTLPIVGMSGLGADRAGTTGASDVSAFLTKPFTPATLRTTLRSVLTGQAPR